MSCVCAIVKSFRSFISFSLCMQFFHYFTSISPTISLRPSAITDIETVGSGYCLKKRSSSRILVVRAVIRSVYLCAVLSLHFFHESIMLFDTQHQVPSCVMRTDPKALFDVNPRHLSSGALSSGAQLPGSRV